MTSGNQSTADCIACRERIEPERGFVIHDYCPREWLTGASIGNNSQDHRCCCNNFPRLAHKFKAFDFARWVPRNSLFMSHLHFTVASLHGSGTCRHPSTRLAAWTLIRLAPAGEVTKRESMFEYAV